MPEFSDSGPENDELLAASLRGLPREKAPPAALEEATVARLRNAGLIRTRARSGPSLASWLLAASIGAVAFVGGSMFAGGGISLTRNDAPTATAARDTQPMFSLLLYGATDIDSSTLMHRAAEYTAWAQQTEVRHASVRVVGGLALGATMSAAAWTGRGPDSVIVGDEPNDPNGLVGTFLISAPSRTELMRLIRDCPHLKYGGRIVIRRVRSEAR